MDKKTWFAAAALAGLGALTVSTPAAAYTSVAVQVGVPATVYVAPPPPPVYEPVRANRHGQMWVAGHWEWNGHRHVWLAGRYVAMRPGYAYQPAVWVQEGPRWGYRPAYWDRPGRGHGDRDHDGVPNRFDHDRDGDGVPNRFDRSPNNPHRR